MPSAPVTLHRGEKRFLGPLEMGGSITSPDTLTGSPTLRAYNNRAKGVDLSAGQPGALLENSPTPPALDGTTVNFWTVLIPLDYAVGNYTVEASCATTSGQTVVEPMRLVVI